MLSPVLWRQCGDGGHISDEQLHCHRALIIDKRRGCFTLLHIASLSIRRVPTASSHPGVTLHAVPYTATEDCLR